MISVEDTEDKNMILENRDIRQEILEIPVVFSSDDNYAQHLGVVINSIIKNKSAGDNLRIYVIDGGISETNLKRLESLIGVRQDVRLRFLKIDKTPFLKFKVSHHVSHATYYRYLIPSLVQEDKVIYLDCDVVVRCSLRNLYREYIEDCYFAGCADFKWEKHAERLGLQKYCNAGVMLINAKRWREENIQEKLMQFTVDYSENLLLRDQDALNTVLKDGIKYLDSRWNAIDSRLAETAFIIHFADSEKPWTPGSMRPMKHEYFKHLMNTPWQSKKLIVSLTSYPARISGVAQVLGTIFNQTLQPDEIVLWLGKERFPHGLADLPEDLLDLEKTGRIIIRWCVDLGPHTKYFYAFKDYPDALIITIDDDVLYSLDLIEKLYQSYSCFPNAVSASLVDFISLSDDRKFFPYAYWPRFIKYPFIPSVHLLAMGVGGVLYPTSLFRNIHNLLDAGTIRQVCLHNDDLWLKAIQLIADIPVVQTIVTENLNYVPESQDIGLWYYNIENGRSDYELDLIQKEIDSRYGQGTFVRKLMKPSVGENLFSKNILYCLIYSKYRTLRIDIRNKGVGNNIIEQSVVPMPSRSDRPSWLPGGICLESPAGEMKIVLRCQGDGELDIRLRGRDERNAEGKRYPVWIDCTYFAVNGEAVFEETKTICHDRPYVYRKPAVDGEVVELAFRWEECHSSSVLEENNRLQSELKISRQKEAEHTASQLQDVVAKNKRLSTDVANLKKALSKLRQSHSKIRSKMQEFRIGAYLKYKVLSKLMLGEMRRRYQEKYQEQKRIYRAIRKGNR